MADINYFLELEPECVKFILDLLGYEEVGRAACVCREFYKELSPRAKTIAHTIQCVEKKTKKKWGDPALTSLTWLDLNRNQITDIAPLSALTSLTELDLSSNQITDLAPLSALTSLTYLYLTFKMPAFQNRFVGDIESFSKGLKKAGRAFKRGGDRVGASQRKKRGRAVSRIPNNHLSNS
eukprot:SAG22_NODE_8996_length_615_cov_7.877907_1_plen_179_part_01